MSSPETRGGEAENLWTQWSRIREEKVQGWNKRRAAEGKPPLSARARSRLLRNYVSPASIGNELIELHAGSDVGMSDPHDVDDAFQLEAKDPVVEEENRIMERLERLRAQQYQAPVVSEVDLITERLEELRSRQNHPRELPPEGEVSN